jgi:hypothetical protein
MNGRLRRGVLHARDAVQNYLGGFFIGYDTAASERLLVFASGRLVKEKRNEL